MQTPVIAQPFSNLQLELLKLFARDGADEDLKAIKDLVAQYFAQKATLLANKAWDEKSLNADLILNTHPTPL